MDDSARTVGALVQEAERTLAGAGIVAARLEAEVLVAFALESSLDPGLDPPPDRSSLLSRSRDAVPETVRGRLRELVARRAGRYPLQYITGRKEFYGLEFMVDERVLIPRPETEMLVDAVLALVRAGWPAGLRVVDVGTGSGCIAIALAVKLPQAAIIATDISHEALALARQNAARHGVEGRIRFMQGDGVAALLKEPDRDVCDVLVSNPPYIAAAALASLQPELRHEPRIALSPGPDGFSATAALLRECAAVVTPGGWIAIEIGFDQAQQAIGALDPALWEDGLVEPDMQGLPRLLLARRAGGPSRRRPASPPSPMSRSSSATAASDESE